MMHSTWIRRCLALTALSATVAALVSACTPRDPDLPPTPISPTLRAALADTTDSLARVFTDAQVTRPTRHTPGTRLPRRGWGNRDGRAVARFIVDTHGRVERATIEVDSTSDPILAQRLVSVLSTWRFVPAKRGGRAVRQLSEERVIMRNHGLVVSLSTDK
jgi:TonB family protein